jgi:hypothetical protein
VRGEHAHGSHHHPAKSALKYSRSAAMRGNSRNQSLSVLIKRSGQRYDDRPA